MSSLSPFAKCFIPKSNESSQQILSTLSDTRAKDKTKYLDTEGETDRVSTHLIKGVSFKARSLRGKLTELHDLLYNGNNTIVAINETWLSGCVTNGLLDPKNLYNIYRKDRISSHPAGGVCILVAKNIASRDLFIDYTKYDAVEVVGCIIELGCRSIRLICCYLAPNLLHDVYLRSLACLEHLLTVTSNLESILLGDFNKPNIDWLNLSTRAAGDDRDFLTFCMDNGLIQLVCEPTRGTNLLDLLLVTDPSVVSAVCVAAPFSISDHDTVNFALYDVKKG